MQVKKTQLSDTKVKLTIVADDSALQEIKSSVVRRLSGNIKTPGFRAGKAPLNLAEKQIDPSALQTEFLDESVNRFYVDTIDKQKLRPVAQPKIDIIKFVPFTTLEFTAEVEVVGEIKLPDYKNIKLEKKPMAISPKDVDEVVDRLRLREADKKEVNRAAKDGDEVWIDFKGVDAETKAPIQGADGKDYPLILGSNTFIPGFEPKLVGLKPGEEKTFIITFPKDYGVAALQNRKVSFTVNAHKVNEVVSTKVDDAFAAKVGPFKTVTELKADIKKQLSAERQREAQTAYENELVTKITEKSTLVVPAVLVDEQIDQMEQEERQNLTYRGQTWQEHLEAEGISEEQHRERNRSQAEQRVKAGLVLSEISELEKITVTPEELEIRIQILKGQYQDAQMQAELDKPENRRDIMSRLLTEKTLQRLTKTS